MSSAIGAVIAFVLSNFTLSFLVLGLVVALVVIARARRPRPPGFVVETLLACYCFFAVGVTFLYNFVMHCFFGAIAASFIGWADSPFQFEVGTASLGFSLVGFLAAFRGFDMRLAAVLGTSAFLLGAAGGHVYQMVTAGNFAPGNAGIIFWTDILVPVIGFVLLTLSRRHPAR
ncbi:hypothetical protein OSH08_05845 [Kaistia geumhonensis]|uniref:Uncharacterized protein n=1 Tax=Kaistia geumhonensis TaxID=410839 RepID=A0ABU0M5M3_9HYPH|nr:DUF6790 family protein [Kaistia geumhonensis]MCX5478516.1 hypothetical protein [Kaistia geumhonensis]MDQ0516266.1 hypothetical protein [Kaistia geumhonensis]